MILLSQFNPVTQQGLKNFCGYFHGHTAVLDSGTPESWAWLVCQLQQAADREDWFPSGKWATIQAIQDRLSMLAKASLELADPAGVQ